MNTAISIRFTLGQIFTLTFTMLFLAPGIIPAAEPMPLPLWPQGAPGSQGKSGAETVRVTDAGEHVVSNIHQPSITPFLPPQDQATGAAILIAPGGAHRELWMDHEGYNLARWLQKHGIAGIVLKYRLARAPESTYTIEDHALPDTQRAMRLIRHHAKEWNIDPVRLGVIGFSAGGELAALVSMRYDDGHADASDPVDREGCKPAFQALIYPGRSGTIIPTKDSPPVFLACGNNDRPDISEGLAQVYLAFKKVGAPAELHVFAKTGHGFGMRPTNQGPAAGWPDRLYEWMGQMEYLKPRSP